MIEKAFAGEMNRVLLNMRVHQLRQGAERSIGEVEMLFG
jgi:hypothetical protein